MASALIGARAELKAGARALGSFLDEAQADRLLAYQKPLAEWNRVYNLTAIHDAGDILAHHLLDSLSVVSRVAELTRRAQPDAPRVLGVGLDGGLPGIPLAIAFPGVSVAMVDIVQKKTALLTQCRAGLGLANTQSHQDHVKKLADVISYGVIASHTFAELANFINLAGRLPMPSGRMVVMKGVHPGAEIGRLPADWTIEAIRRLTVPGLPVECHLITLAPST